MKICIVNSDNDLVLGVKDLISREAKFAHILDLVGTPKLRKRIQGFPAILKIIISQQLSVSAANSIWKRFIDNELTSPAAILQKDPIYLRDLGLSRSKITYVKCLAKAGINFRELAKLPDTDVLEELVKIKGVGPWTAQIYAMFSLRRRDIFAPGDLALQEAVKLLFQHRARPSEKDLCKISLPWSPNRTIAALMLWDYYNFCKLRKGISF